MSAIIYIASDYPLKEVPNPHLKTLSVNEALSIGMEDIPEQFLEPGFDRNKPDVLLWSDIIDTQSQLDDDFAIWPLDSSTEDIYTEKQYRVCLEWDYTKGRAEKVIQYIWEHLEHTSEVEIWHVWLGDGVRPKIRNCTIALDEFTSDDLKELSDLEVWREPITHYYFTIKSNPTIRNDGMTNILSFEELDRMLGDHAPFLMSLSDGLQEELHIVISAAKVGNLGDNIPDFEDVDETTRQALQGILAKSRPIEINENCLFEICFYDYIIYQIRNESFCSGDPNEVRHGKYLFTIEKSKLLSHLEEITDAQQLDDGSFYPGEWTHYGIYTQNHVIDIISHCPPEVSCRAE